MDLPVKLYKIVRFVIIWCSAMSSASFCGPPDDRSQVFDVILAGRVQDGSIELKVTVRNRTKEELHVRVPDWNPLFDVSIWDRSGVDRAAPRPNLQKDGRRGGIEHKSIIVTLPPSGEKTYELRVGQIVSSVGVLSPVPAEAFEIEARIATIANIDGTDVPTVHKSNVIRLTVLDNKR